MIVVPVVEAQDLPRRIQVEVDLRGSALAIVELKRMPDALRLFNHEKGAEGCCMGVAIVTFLQVLVLLQEDTVPKNTQEEAFLASTETIQKRH